MSYEVRVQKWIDFRNGVAAQRQNVYGPMHENMVHFKDHFTDDTLSTDKWATSVPGTSDTIAISEIEGGVALITTGTADNDSCMMGTSIIWSGTKKAIIEARIHMVDVSGTGLFVGFSDAKSEANNSIAIHYPADSLTTVASDAAGFVIDADHSTSSIMCASVQGDSDTTPIDTGVDWADGETKVLRVELDSTTAIFYLDGGAVASIASSVTAATLLCGTVQAITRANDGANVVRVYRVDVWQDE
jgi:hypothetical protein|tara:strand:+ start:6164 stop:6898 length:735 start_codon:yes stop_codon:yes gene_type:complete